MGCRMILLDCMSGTLYMISLAGKDLATACGSLLTVIVTGALNRWATGGRGDLEAAGVTISDMGLT